LVTELENSAVTGAGTIRKPRAKTDIE